MMGVCDFGIRDQEGPLTSKVVIVFREKAAHA